MWMVNKNDTRNKSQAAKEWIYVSIIPNRFDVSIFMPKVQTLHKTILQQKGETNIKGVIKQ